MAGQPLQGTRGPEAAQTIVPLIVRGRVIDVSEALARRLGMRRRGTARVRVEVLPQGSRR